MTSSQKNRSGPEIRAEKLFSRIDSNLFEWNEQKPIRELALSNDEKGTSVLRSDGLLIDDPKEKRPKKYEAMQPDVIWQGDFIEVKGNIMGKNWEKLSIHSLNDQLRILFLRLKNDCISDLARYQFADLMPTEQQLVERDLAPFKQSPPNERCYVRWDEIISAVPSPNDNFKTGSIQISGFQLPVRIVSGLERKDSPRLYLLDNEMMNRWEQVLF
jgi:hypothetical protein